MSKATLPAPKANTKLDHEKAFAGLKTDSDFTKDAAGIKTTGERFQQRVQLHALAILWRAVQTGDIRPMAARANAMIAAMPEGARLNALRAWVERNLKLTYCEDGEAKGTFIQGTLKLRDLDFNAAVGGKKWWEEKPEAPYKPFDLDAELTRLVKVATKRMQSAKPGDNVDPEHVAKLQAFIATLAVSPAATPDAPAANVDPLASAAA